MVVHLVWKTPHLKKPYKIEGRSLASALKNMDEAIKKTLMDNPHIKTYHLSDLKIYVTQK